MAQPGTGKAVCLRPAACDPCRVGLVGWMPRRRPAWLARVEVEQAIAQTRLVVVVPLGLRGRHDLDLARVQPKAFVDRANLRLGGLRIRRKIRLAQLSITAGAMLESLMSASDCVANMTLTFFLRSVLSHWRMRAANTGSSRNSRFIEDQQRGRAVEAFIEAGEQVAQHGQHRRLAVHQFFHLEALHAAGTRRSASASSSLPWAPPST